MRFELTSLDWKSRILAIILMVYTGATGVEPILTESKSVELTNYSIPQYCGEVDLNHRPSAYEADELPDCSIPL